ncbi:MAG: MauE/DoxX family redox-associated membrane protein [Acidimicrobiales bacterium]|jgi:hypothetical protein
MELIGPYLIGCVLLVGAGAIKAVRPDDTARALLPIVPTRLRPVLPFRVLRTLIRLLAGVEVGVGALGLLLPRPLTGALVGVSYFAFAGLMAYARSQGGALASCGCFGTPDTPATYLHVGLDLVIGGAAAAVAVEVPTRGWLMNVLAQQPLHGLPLMALAAVGAGVAYLTLSGLARLQAVRLPVAPTERSR